MIPKTDTSQDDHLADAQNSIRRSRYFLDELVNTLSNDFQHSISHAPDTAIPAPVFSTCIFGDKENIMSAFIKLTVMQCKLFECEFKLFGNEEPARPEVDNSELSDQDAAMMERYLERRKASKRFSVDDDDEDDENDLANYDA